MGVGDSVRLDTAPAWVLGDRVRLDTALAWVLGDRARLDAALAWVLGIVLGWMQLLHGCWG